MLLCHYLLDFFLYFLQRYDTSLIFVWDITLSGTYLKKSAHTLIDCYLLSKLSRLNTQTHREVGTQEQRSLSYGATSPKSMVDDSLSITNYHQPWSDKVNNSNNLALIFKSTCAFFSCSFLFNKILILIQVNPFTFTTSWSLQHADFNAVMDCIRGTLKIGKNWNKVKGLT